MTRRKTKVTRYPMAPTWSETMLTTVAFTAEGAKQIRVTVEWEIYGDASAVEKETFNKANARMTHGWGGSLDKLEEHLNEHGKNSCLSASFYKVSR